MVSGATQVMDGTTARAALQQLGRVMLETGLVWGNAGNISVRTAPDRFLITASGTRLGELAADDLVECGLDGRAVDSQGRRPSKETPMHRAVYEVRPEINAVLHASPFYATLLACSREDLPANWFVEDMYYLERVARVPYAHPGSTDLGEAVRRRARDANVLLLENHGVLVYDTSADEALMALQTLEMVCRMRVTAAGAGVEMNALPADVVQDFLTRSGYRPRREWPR